MKTYQQLEQENERLKKELDEQGNGLEKVINQSLDMNEKLILIAGAYLDLSAESGYNGFCKNTEKICNEILLKDAVEKVKQECFNCNYLAHGDEVRK